MHQVMMGHLASKPVLYLLSKMALSQKFSLYLYTLLENI